MEVYLGRQPILDRGWNIAGFELFFRSSWSNFRDSTDDVSATSQVIVNAILGVGLDRLLGGKPAFINFDQTLLLGDWTTVLPPDKVVIEILGAVQPDEAALTACHRLREQGYALALDACRDDRRSEVFAPFVDILKVDFQETPLADRESAVSRYKKLGLRMVAAKVETESEFSKASQLGYDYFQGFFFASPAVLRTSHVPASKVSGLRLVRLIQQEDIDLAAVEEVIRRDISFSHSLLKYLNSAAFHWAGPIESVRQALHLLGSVGIRRWVWMASLPTLAQNRPPVLVAQVLMRGRFCEVIAGRAKSVPGNVDPFLAGMFSLLDAILQKPLEEILVDLNAGPFLRGALLGTAGNADPLSMVLRIVKAYERGDFHAIDAEARVLGLSPETLNTCYLEALDWVESTFKTDEQTWPATRMPGLTGFHRASGVPAVR